MSARRISKSEQAAKRKRKEAARKAFDEFNENASADDTVYLAKIENPKYFGFGSRGDMFGLFPNV